MMMMQGVKFQTGPGDPIGHTSVLLTLICWPAFLGRAGWVGQMLPGIGSSVSKIGIGWHSRRHSSIGIGRKGLSVFLVKPFTPLKNDGWKTMSLSGCIFLGARLW